MYKTKEEIENWLKKYKIKDYFINEDLTVNVNRSVSLSDKSLTSIPVKFNIIKGNFVISRNNLINLKNSPSIVYGHFLCENNKITSLENAPDSIIGWFNVANNKLTDLKNCPNIVGQNSYFNCSNNELTSLEGCQLILPGGFNCENNKLTSFKYFPEKINGLVFSMKNNNIPEKFLSDFNVDISLVEKFYSDFNIAPNKEEFLNVIRIKKELKELKELNTNIRIKNNKKI